MSTTRKHLSAKTRAEIFARHHGVWRKFEEKFIPEPNSGCWLWIGARKEKGYGHMLVGRQFKLAHRLSWELHHGPIPDGMVIRHRCDVPCCVNPDHLEIGTHKENIWDCIRRGRARRGRLCGEQASQSKLTWHQVNEIRNSGGYYGYRKLFAKKFGVSESAVGKIFRRATWSDPA